MPEETIPPPDLLPSEDPPPQDPPPDEPGDEVPAPPLPLPDLPAGAIVVTCQANIPGYPPTAATIHPRVATKMVRLVQDSGQMVDGAWVPRWPGMTEMFMDYVRSTLFADLESRYPDEDAVLADLEAQVVARRAELRALPVFLEV